MTTLLELAPVELPAAADRRELICGECGYGAIVRGEPPECPMCRGRSWQEVDRRVQIAA